MSWIPSYKKPAGGSGGGVYVPCSWSTGTDAEIAEALKKHYAGAVDLSEYWAIGDERVIHLNSMTAPNPNSSNTWLAQDITVVIVDFDHTDLETPISSHTKAAITVQTKELLSGTAAGTAGNINIDGNTSSSFSFIKWSNLYVRTYLNSTVYNAFQTDFKALIKPSKHYRHTTYNGTASEQVTDNLFLPSYPEICGTIGNSCYTATNPTEGTQLAYYANGDSTRWFKYINNNGSQGSNKNRWWLGSTSNSYTSTWGYWWMQVLPSSGINIDSYDSAKSLAPAWAM